MKNKYKIILIICVIIGICSILVGSIAYYRIVVEGNIKGSTGNAVFVLKDENSNVWNNKEINLGKVNPGDSGSFTVTMDASGSTVDMYATLEIERTNLPTNLKFYTTSDHKSELHKYYSFLEKSGTNSETLTIYWYWNPYISDEEDSKFINVSNLEANIRVSAVQISEYAMMKNGYNGSYAFWGATYKPYIRTITFGNDLSNLPSECTEENLCWDVSYSSTQNKKVYGYLIDSGIVIEETDTSTSTTTTKTLYNLYIVSEAPIFAPINSRYLFDSFKNTISIEFNDNFNTSKVTNMEWLFRNCSSLSSIDLNRFNTASATTMERLFFRCSSLEKIDFSSFNTSQVVNLAGMFTFCSSLTSLELSSINTSKVTDMSVMFSWCSSLESLDLNGFNTSNVTNMGQMFYKCLSLTNLDLSSFNTSKVNDMNSMFSYCTSLTSLDLSNFNTKNVSKITSMFSECSSLTNLDLSNFNTSKITMYGYGTSTGSGMFSGCSKLTTTINIMNGDITEYYSMFFNAATETSAQITVNYIASLDTIAEGETQSLIDKMIATKSSNSNIVKGKQL